MALNAGDAACTVGLSKRFYDALVAKWAPGYVPGPEWKDVCHSFATAVVDEIQANAAISGGVATIETTDAGLQRDPATSTDCLGPSAQKTVVVTGGIA
jgi:hypothetical protein